MIFCILMGHSSKCFWTSNLTCEKLLLFTRYHTMGLTATKVCSVPFSIFNLKFKWQANTAEWKCLSLTCRQVFTIWQSDYSWFHYINKSCQVGNISVTIPETWGYLINPAACGGIQRRQNHFLPAAYTEMQYHICLQPQSTTADVSGSQYPVWQW